MKKRIALLMALAVVGGSVFAGVSTAATTVTKPKIVRVTATDFHFAISLKTFKRGVKYKFIFKNKGAALHNFDIQGIKATKIITHGKTASFTVTFKKKGKLQYVCDVPRHIELGMAGYITVR